MFKDYIDLKEFAVSGFLGALIYAGLGIIVTTILQSSSATLALILTAVAAQQIQYENALALAIGANIGTTITAILGSLTSNVSGKRLAGAHFIFNVLTAIVALVFIFPLAKFVKLLAEFMGIASDDYTLKLAIFHTLFNVLGVVLLVPFIGRLERFLIKVIKDKSSGDVVRPKFLFEAAMQFPTSALESLLKESKDLFKNAIFEIVSHALNIHRDDIKSDQKIKKIIKKSTEDMNIDVEELYYKKVKTIYSEIIKYATAIQSKLTLSEKQNQAVSEIKIANRKMVEILSDVREINKNVSRSLSGGNPYLLEEYNHFRAKVTQVLRVIYLFRTEDNAIEYRNKLQDLKLEAKNNMRHSSESIDKLIRKDLITAEMASSLFNDNTNVNDMIRKLITVAELLYGKIDTLLENQDN